MSAQSEAFKAAVADSKKLTSKPSNEDLLEIYGSPPTHPVQTPKPWAPSPLANEFSPQVSTRSPPARTSRPPPSPACLTSRQATTTLLFFLPCYRPHLEDINHPTEKPNQLTAHPPKQGKAKYNAWQKVVDDALTAEQAQEKYVAKINEMKDKYGYDAAKEPEAVGGSA